MAELDDVLRKIQALIAKADGTDFPEEAEAFRRKAEAMMARYRIEESMLASAAPAGTVLAPTWSEWRVCRYSNEFRGTYREVASWIVQHVGCRAVFKLMSIPVDGQYEDWYVMDVVGYESDLRYGEMLLTASILSFGQRMEPKYDRSESEQVNAYRFRKAGMEARRIAEIFWGTFRRGMGTKIVKLYKAEAVKRGEDPRELSGNSVNVKTYRESYARGFSDEIFWRLQRMRYTAGEESQALILAGRKDAVDEAFYEKFPQYRPREYAGSIGDGHATCKKCQKAKSGYCRDHYYLKPTKARPEKVNWSARSRGEEAARSVDLGTTGRLDR